MWLPLLCCTYASASASASLQLIAIRRRKWTGGESLRSLDKQRG